MPNCILPMFTVVLKTKSLEVKREAQAFATAKSGDPTVFAQVRKQ